MNNELKIWFDNFNNRIENKITIFLNTNYSINRISNVNVNIINYMEKDVLGKSNKIYFTNMRLDSSNTHCDKFFNFIFQEPIIIINDETNVNKFLDLLNNYNNEDEIDVDYYLVDKKDFNELLQMDSQELSKLLEKEHLYLRHFYPKLPMLNEEFILSSLRTLKERNILTASFANYLYKFASLNFTANTTRVGIKIRKLLGIKSKTINHIRTTDALFPYGKPFKGYDLKADKHLEIKKKIAQKLLKLGDKKLNIDKIAEITELSIKEVKDLSTKI